MMIVVVYKKYKKGVRNLGKVPHHASAAAARDGTCSRKGNLPYVKAKLASNNAACLYSQH